MKAGFTHDSVKNASQRQEFIPGWTGAELHGALAAAGLERVELWAPPAVHQEVREAAARVIEKFEARTRILRIRARGDR